MLKELITCLSDKYTEDGPERVGFILTSGEVIETENVSKTPKDSFEVDFERHLDIIDNIKASWHTHPGESSKLSNADSSGFRSFPEWSHYIVGQDGLREYIFNKGILVNGDYHQNLRNCPEDLRG
jgi:proteasome lid subunit RPN8/RPN11